MKGQIIYKTWEFLYIYVLKMDIKWRVLINRKKDNLLRMVETTIGRIRMKVGIGGNFHLMQSKNSTLSSLTKLQPHSLRFSYSKTQIHQNPINHMHSACKTRIKKSSIVAKLLSFQWSNAFATIWKQEDFLLHQCFKISRLKIIKSMEQIGKKMLIDRWAYFISLHIFSWFISFWLLQQV